MTDFIQTRFYNPSVVNSYIKENSKDAEISQAHILELQKKFALTLEEPAVRNSFHYNQDHDDIFERSRIYGILLETTGGLLSVQFVDINGIRLHYSTLARDIISQSSDSASYRNYTEDPLSLPYDAISVTANGTPKYTMDGNGERIIYSFPFVDSMNVYRGTAVFSVSVRALAEKLISEGRLKVNEDVSIISSPPGVLFGSPDSAKKDIFRNVSMIWNQGKQGRITLDAEDSGMKFSLISFKTDNDLFFGRLVNDALFSISDSLRITFYLAMFLTFYLTLFFLTNFKPNPVTVVQNRLTKLKDNLFEQLYVRKSSQDKVKWIFELEQRRDGIRSELKSNLKMSKRSKKTIDAIIDKSWDEFLAVMKSGSPAPADKIIAVKPVDEIDEAVELCEVEEIENVEEITEEIDEAEGLNEAEEIDEVESIDEPEELGEVEEASDVEETDEIEEITEVEEISEAEEIDEVEIDEVESIDEPEELDEVEEAADVEEIDEVKEISEAEEISETEEIDEVESIDEPEELGEVEELAKIEPDKTEESPEISGRSLGLLKHAMKIAEDKVKIIAQESSTEILSDNQENETPVSVSKGLLALASEIEFNNEYPVFSEPEDEEQIDAEFDIVSPFASMFSALRKKERTAGKKGSVSEKKKPAAAKKKSGAKEKPVKKKTASAEKKPSSKKRKPAADNTPAEENKTAVDEKKPGRKRKPKKDQ